MCESQERTATKIRTILCAFRRLPAPFVILAGILPLASSVQPVCGEITIRAGEWEPVVPLRHGLFSVAVGLQIANVNEGHPEQNESLMACLEEMASPILRLPGGDSMNRWNWDTGSLVGTDRPGIGVERWHAIARRGKSTPMWGINVSTVSPDVTERFARTLRAKGYAGTFFELGNELYLKHWRAQVAHVADYIAKAKAHAAVLRKHFPECTLGVPLASYWGLVKEVDGQFAFRTPPTLSRWARALGEESFYDAVVVHLYTTPWDLGFLGKYTKEQVARWGWVKADRAVIDGLFGLCERTAPGKEVWVTEWAFNATQYLKKGKGYPTERRWLVHHTILAVLYDARFMLNTATGQNSATVMTTWTLVDQPAVALWKRKGGPTVRYELFRMLRQAREGNDAIARFTPADTPSWRGPEGSKFSRMTSDTVDIVGFSRGGKLTAALVLNVLPTPVNVSATVLPAHPTDARSLTADDILPGWGNSDNPLPRDWSPAYRYEKPVITEAGIKVAPHSVTITRYWGVAER